VHGIERRVGWCSAAASREGDRSVRTLASKAQRFVLVADGQFCPRFGDEMGNGSSVCRRQALDLKEDEGGQRSFVEAHYRFSVVAVASEHNFPPFSVRKIQIFLF
jgi:hypothetical protein